MKLKKLFSIVVMLLIFNTLHSQTPNAGEDGTICNSATQLQAEEPVSGNGIWSVVQGNGNFVNPTLNNTIVTNLAPGENILRWTVDLEFDEVVITNNQIADAGEDFSADGYTAYLNAVLPEAASGFWSVLEGNGIIEEINNPNSLVTNLSVGINRFQWSVNYENCISFDEVEVTAGIYAYAGPDFSVCDTIAYLNAASPMDGATGEWTTIAGYGNFVNPTLHNTQVYGVYEGINTYKWTVTKDGSSSSDEVQVINNQFYVDAGEDQIVTVPNATLAADLNYTGEGTWSIVAGQGVFENPQDPQTIVSNIQFGYNTFRWYVHNGNTGCDAFDDVNIIFNGFNVYAGVDQHICSDTTNLQAEPVGGTALTWWTVVEGSANFENTNDPYSFVSGLSRGENVLRWNVLKNGLHTYDDVSIFNYQFDTYAGEDQHLCSDFAVLHAEGMLDYGILSLNTWEGQWELLDGGGTFYEPTSDETYITGLDPNENLVLWTVTRTNINLSFAGQLCQAKDTVSLFLHDILTPDFSMSPVNAGCSPLTIEFQNTTNPDDTIQGTTYTWARSNGGFIENHSYNDDFIKTFTNPSDSEDLTYNIILYSEVEATEGVVCKDSIAKPITIWNNPRVDFEATPEVQYFPSTMINIMNFSSPDCESYYWDFGNDDQLSQNVFNDYFPYSGYETWGEYDIKLVVDNGRCIDSLTKTIQILAPEPARLYNDSIQDCAVYSREFEIRDILYTNDTLSQYLWNIFSLPEGILETQINMFPGDVLPEPYLFTEAGTFEIEVYASGEGSDWQLVHVGTDVITIYDIPKADFEIAPLEVMLPDQPIRCYNYSENADSYEWDFGDFSTEDFNDFEPTHYYKEEGEYYVKLSVISEEGCTDSKTSELPVIVNKPGDLIFPTAFLPNPDFEGDGSLSSIASNDVFLPKIYDGVSEYKLQIVNRYGVVVFESNDPVIGWTGYYNHKLCEKGAYKYFATGKYNGGASYKFVGEVILLY